MKATNYIGLSLVSLIALGGANMAQADGLVKEKISAETIIGVRESDHENFVPGPESLLLEQVPKAYNFVTNVKKGNYDITADVKNEEIVVFNDRTERDWSVVAKVEGDLTANNSGHTTHKVEGFEINGVELSNTGGSGIVSQAEKNKKPTNNTGLISKPVTTIKVKFIDDKNELKPGNDLTGLISYQLYNTPDGK